jgi:hypothetical protein
LPRAFSDIPRSWVGSTSSADDAEGVRECKLARDEVGWSAVDEVSSCSSSSSSSPIAKALLSSGTSVREGALVLVGLRMLSPVPDLERWIGLCG